MPKKKIFTIKIQRSFENSDRKKELIIKYSMINIYLYIYNFLIFVTIIIIISSILVHSRGLIFLVIIRVKHF